MKIHEINLFRTLPACLVISFGVSPILGMFPASAHSHAIPAVLLSVLVTSVFCIFVRLGRLPWFEMKDGKKHGLIVWLEERLPFLSAKFYRK